MVTVISTPTYYPIPRQRHTTQDFVNNNISLLNRYSLYTTLTPLPIHTTNRKQYTYLFSISVICTTHQMCPNKDRKLMTPYNPLHLLLRIKLMLSPICFTCCYYTYPDCPRPCPSPHPPGQQWNHTVPSIIRGVR